MAAPTRTPIVSTRRTFLLARVLLGALVAALSMLAGSATASSPYLFTPADEVREASPTFRYANMSNEEAYAELDRRGVPYTNVGRVDGVGAPVRLAGPLHGVHVHSSLPEHQRADSLFEILDARLALSLDDFCELLSRHDIVEVVHYTMYRPNGPKPEDPHSASSRTAKRSSTHDSGKRSSGKRSNTRSSGTKSGKRSSANKSSRKGLGKGASSGKQRSASRAGGKKQKAGSKPRSKGKPANTKPANTKSGSTKSGSRTKSENKSSPKASKPARRSSTRSRARTTGRSGRGGSKGRRAETRAVVKQTYSPPGTRHPAGLAIDVGGLRKRDGRWLSVAHHFDGRLGARTCGPTATPPKSAEGRELWSIVCEAADLGLFTYVLTPNFDKWHGDHLHMEIRGDVRWFLYH